MTTMEGIFLDIMEKVRNARQDLAEEMNNEIYVVIAQDHTSDSRILCHILLGSLENAHERGEYLAFLRDTHCADAVGFIAEAWTASISEEGDLTDDELGDLADEALATGDKREALIASLFEGAADPKSWLAPITNEGKTVEAFEAVGEMRGTMRGAFESASPMIPEA